MNFNFSIDKLEPAASLWGAAIQYKMKGSNHHFYAAAVGQQPAVMRITPIEHRDMYAVLGEIEFMQYLHGKAPVAKVLRSLQDMPAVQVEIEGRQVIVCMFQMIGGNPVNNEKSSQVGIIQLWGGTMGTLHNCSRQFSYAGHYYRQLDGDVLLTLAKSRIGKEIEIIELMEKKWNEIIARQLTDTGWGLIHGDLTQSNMHYFNQKLYVFDFDECLLAPYLYDIAITIHITLMGFIGKDGWQERSERFIENFIKGYKAQCDNDVDIATLKVLMDFYNILIYIHISQYGDHPFKENIMRIMRDGSLTGLNINI